MGDSRCVAPEPPRCSRKRAPSSKAPLHVSFSTLGGDSSFENYGVTPTTTLGDIQRDLCCAFRKPFPKTSAALVPAEGVRPLWQFHELPFATCADGAEFQVLFELTSQMQKFDAEDRVAKNKIAFSLPSGENVRLSVTNVTYEQALRRVLPSWSSEPVLARADGTVAGLSEYVDSDEELILSF